MQKRGQITVFVVIGIIIIALIVLLVVVSRQAELTAEEREQQLAMQVPEKAREVYSFVQSCIEDTASGAVDRLSLQGGYTELPETHIVTPAHPFATYLEVLPDTEVRTAYWFYEAPNGIQKSGMPAVEEMEAQLASYVEQHLADCTLDFELFRQYNITAGEITAKADIEKDRVIFTVDFPVEIRMEDFSYDLKSFYADIDSGLGQLYIMAKNIIDSGNTDYFLEERVIDVLAMYEEIPFSGTEFTCAPKIWTKSDVLSAIRDYVSLNMQFIKLKGTDFAQREDYFVWDALEGSHGDISVNFQYSPSWPVEMDVYPSEGELLRAQPMMEIDNRAMAYLVSLFCLTDYNFVYDLKLPVLVTLSDDDTVFRFATMVIIDNNQPRENKLGTLDIPEPEQKICENAIHPAAIYAVVPDASGNLIPVSGAEIRMKCINTVCDIGTTSGRTEPSLKARLPQCVNALLTAEKQGYLSAKQTVSTVDASSFTLQLEPYKELEYEIKVIEEGMERDVEEDETVILQIVGKENEFAETLIQPKGSVELVASELSLASTLITEGFDIKIEGREVTNCYKVPTRNILGLLGFEEEKCTTVKTDDMEIDQVFTGGSEMEWSPSRSELYNANKVTFYIPAKPVPSDMEELEDVYSMMDNPLYAINPMLE